MRALAGLACLAAACRAARPAVDEQRSLRSSDGPVHVNFDTEATVLDFSNETLTFSPSVVNFGSLRRNWNPKNGTPWFRYKKASDAGESSHDHLGGLTASGDFDYDILHAHNIVRARAGLKNLQWSSGLQSLADRRVKKLAHDGCYIQHSPVQDRSYEAGFEYVGENLYKVINMAPTGVDIVDAWYAEIDDYSYGKVGDPCVKEKCIDRSQPPCMMGHFTQVMWQRSTHVGCAQAECPNEAKRTFVSVCNYGPGGNIVGQTPFDGHVAQSCGLEAERCPLAHEHKSGTRGLAPGLAALAAWGYVAAVAW